RSLPRWTRSLPPANDRLAGIRKAGSGSGAAGALRARRHDRGLGHRGRRGGAAGHPVRRRDGGGARRFALATEGTLDSQMTTHAGVELQGTIEPGFDEVLTRDALDFVAELHRRFDPIRRELLSAREARRARLAAGEMLDFLPDTPDIREGDWQVAPVPADMQQRWVEITGPTDRKMMINALNSGADGFMADFEDANSPTWHNMVDGHINLRD